jgi:multifunctional 2-oxoglutarate metabolism enzyme
VLDRRKKATPVTPPTSPDPSTFGPNEWLVDDLYQRYLADKTSVDPSWWDFFADYTPAETLRGESTRTGPLALPDANANGGSAAADPTNGGSAAAPDQKGPATVTSPPRRPPPRLPSLPRPPRRLLRLLRRRLPPRQRS